MPFSLEAIARAGCFIALGVVAFRAFPILVALFVSPVRGRDRALAFLFYTVVASAAVAFSDFKPEELAMALGVMSAAALVQYALARFSPRIGNWSSLPLLFALPAALLPGHALLLLLAWEASFAAHSYCRHAPRASRSLSDYAFFLFVNPAIAYPARGKRVADPGLDSAGLRRATRGVALLFLYGGLSHVATEVHAFAPELIAPAELGARALVPIIRLIGLCAAHFGLASLQIGLCRQLGYAPPERYLEPYLARSPRDFWARWNTYIGSWIRLYVFKPMVRTLTVRLRGRPVGHRLIVNAMALTASFFVVGALHDAFTIASTRTFTASMTGWFVINALVMVAWDAAAILAQKRMLPASRFFAPAAMLGIVATLALALP